MEDKILVYIFFILPISTILVGWIPALLAYRKGRDFFVWWLYGGAFFIVALPHSLLLSSKEEYLKKKFNRQKIVRPDFYNGVSFLKEGKEIEALDSFQSSLNKSSKKKEKGVIYYNIAACHLKLGNTKIAADELKKAIAMDSSLALKYENDKEFSKLRDSITINETISNRSKQQGIVKKLLVFIIALLASIIVSILLMRILE